MTALTLSPTLKTTLAQTLETLKECGEDTPTLTLLAMKQILTRVELGETHLYEPLHRGDLFALTLAKLE